MRHTQAYLKCLPDGRQVYKISSIVTNFTRMKDNAIPFGRDFNDFNIGDIYKHWPGKTITESDNHQFSLLTMNHHPVHLDRNYAESTQHKQILVVGTLVFSLAVGLTVRDVSGKAIANLEYLNIKHTNPVFINDTIYAQTEVLGKVESKSKNDRGVVHVRTNVLNQNDKIVLVFERKLLVHK